MANTIEGGEGEKGRGRIGRVVRILGWGGVAGLLLAPAIAMRFTDEVVWTASDFVFAGVMLIGAGLAGELIAWKSGRFAYRGGASIAVVIAVLLVWVTGAVGIIGNEGEPANLLYLGVIAVAFVGAVIARFKAGGMARAMATAALAQAGVAVAALIMGWGSTSQNYPKDIIGETVVFVVLWLASAALFRKASRAAAS
ncbi:hypothetical protein BH09PSE1_BH09PSE1_17770 [soil metagenome]